MPQSAARLSLQQRWVVAAVVAAAAVVIVANTCVATPVLRSDTVFPEVSWQAHSYNDLREWPQLLRKVCPPLPHDP